MVRLKTGRTRPLTVLEQMEAMTQELTGLEAGLAWVQVVEQVVLLRSALNHRGRSKGIRANLVLLGS